MVSSKTLMSRFFHNLLANVCIAINQRHPAVVAQFEDHAVKRYLPTLVLVELHKGIYCSRHISHG
ncbi:MAG: hypothetical protein AAF892_09280 [Cyanobacteria bacterium P01_D01_bin.71]